MGFDGEARERGLNLALRLRRLILDLAPEPVDELEEGRLVGADHARLLEGPQGRREIPLFEEGVALAHELLEPPRVGLAGPPSRPDRGDVG